MYIDDANDDEAKGDGDVEDDELGGEEGSCGRGEDDDEDECARETIPNSLRKLPCCTPRSAFSGRNALLITSGGAFLMASAMAKWRM